MDSPVENKRCLRFLLGLLKVPASIVDGLGGGGGDLEGFFEIDPVSVRTGNVEATGGSDDPDGGTDC